jgi:GntR family transcriptional regulator
MSNMTTPVTNAVQPLYLQIKGVLKQRIFDGEYAPHERLPSESALMKMFGVSRITVRQALRDLHSEGLIFSVQGKGSFVSKPKIVQDVQRLQGFGEAMSGKGYDTSGKVLAIQQCRAPMGVAKALELGSQAEVIEVQRIRYLNCNPVSVDQSYFPLDIGESLFGRDLSQDIFPLLENELGINLGYAELKIEATRTSTEIAEHLGLEQTDPVLRISRLVFDANNRPVDFEYVTYRGDAYQYQLRIDRT